MLPQAIRRQHLRALAGQSFIFNWGAWSPGQRLSQDPLCSVLVGRVPAQAEQAADDGPGGPQNPGRGQCQCEGRSYGAPQVGDDGMDDIDRGADP